MFAKGDPEGGARVPSSLLERHLRLERMVENIGETCSYMSFRVSTYFRRILLDTGSLSALECSDIGITSPAPPRTADRCEERSTIEEVG
jgi:hypothetical protein